jgi:putative aldouronate transport system substrate-binding protein
MKKMLRNGVVFFLVILMVFTVFSGCTKKTDTPTPDSTAATTASANTSAATSKPEEPKDPFGKFDKLVTYEVARNLGNEVIFKEGESLDNNDWSKLYEEKFNIKLDYVWTVPEDQYVQKVSLTIASGDLPDMMAVPLKDFLALVEDNRVQDLTEVFNEFASPLVKDYAVQDKLSMDAATFNGKLMGIPNIGNEITAGSAHLLCIRKDWLDNLGLQVPKTIDDVLELAKAFAENDPNKSGKKDTFGFGISKEIFQTGLLDNGGFFAGFGAYPKSWIKDSSGNIQYSGIQPQMKEALLKLQELYKAGAIDKEFLVKDRWKAGEDITSGQIGLYYGVGWAGIWMARTKQANLNAEWVTVELPTLDGKPAMMVSSSPVANKKFYFIKKGVEHPEGLLKLMNASAEMGDGSWFSKENAEKYLHGKIGEQNVDFFKYQFTGAVASETQPEHAIAVGKAVIDPSSTNKQTVLNDAANINKWLKEKDATQLTTYYLWNGPDSVFGKFYKYVQNEQIFVEDWDGIPTPTMLESKSTLDKKQLEYYTAIIAGEDISLFDTFVKEWKALGGDEMTKEVNEAMKKK